MDIIELLRELYETLIDMVVVPIDLVLESYSGKNTSDYNLSIGFGSVEWFNIPIDELIVIVLGLIFGFIILRLVYRFIKWLFRLGKGLVGIR